jgi:tetratricopeptide (TPR) repeat protein
MTLRKSRLARATVLLFVAVLSSAAFADALTDRAKRLLEQKQPRQAYDLLLPQEGARAGDPEFDYLLGIAAIDSGEPERGVFALERVLAIQPNNHVARAEIARAYLALGERDAARREFETVRAQQVPADVKQTIDGYLSAIASSDVTKVTGFLEFGVGYDTNVNSATGSSQLAVPVLGGAVFTLDPTATRNSDGFTALAGAVNVTHKFASEWSLLGSVAGAMKTNFHEDKFDTVNFDGSLGVRWARGAEALTLAGQFQDFELDHASYRVATGAIAQWQHSFTERTQGTLYAQYANLHYPGQDIRDVNRSVFGAALGHAFTGAYAPVFFGSVYFGREKPETEGVPQLGHDLAGVRLGGQLRLTTGLTAFGNLAFERREYGGEDTTFLVTRRDNQFDALAGVSYLLRPGTTLIGQVAYTDNHSNIQIDQFNRTVATISLRFSF